MKLVRLAFAAVICSILASCFKDEPLNAECDIEEAWVHVDAPESMFFNLSDTLVKVLSDNSNIVFTIRGNSDLTAIAPIFKLTEGATIVPENGSVHDFSAEQPVTYTVTSQDKAWSRTYTVTFRKPKMTLQYDFENYRLNEAGDYYTWKELAADGSMLDIWATGNPGFRIANSKAAPEDYPTAPLLTGGFDGAGVKLETRSTGQWGVIARKRLAAGNLFIGVFDTDSVLKAPKKSTLFGIRFNKEPSRLKGYYKYTPGENYQDFDGKILSNVRDSAAIYSVLYRNHDSEGNEVVLHGDDVMTNPNIVAIARLWDVKYADEWTEFDVEYKYSEPLDYTLLANYGYSITIVFSSSKNGDEFEGAVGSTLCIDKVSMECIEKEGEEDNQ